MAQAAEEKPAVKVAGVGDSEGHIFEGMIAPEKDRFVRPKEAVVITGRSLASQYRDKKAGKWPPMYRLGDNSVANKLSDLIALNASRPVVTVENTRALAPEVKRGRKPKMRW